MQSSRETILTKQHSDRHTLLLGTHAYSHTASASGAAHILPYAYTLDPARLPSYTGPPTYPKAERPEEDDELVALYLSDSKLTSDN